MTFEEFVPHLSTVNAALNTVSAVLITLGIVAIKKKNEGFHKKCMLLASVVSAIFLTSYVVYHMNVGSVPYERTGAIRSVYFFILISHIILAATLVPLVPLTLFRGLKEQRIQHRKVAHWSAPLWAYVSVTGVVIYLMLYIF